MPLSLRLIALLLGLLLVGHESLAQPVTSPQQLKIDALTALEQLTSSDKKLQSRIAKAIKALTRSLTDEKGHALFLGAFRLRPPSQGNKVFEGERQAVKQLLKGLEQEATPDDIKAVLHAIITDLVAADRTIAERSLDIARRVVQIGHGKADKLKEAQQVFEKALRESKPHKAIERFEEAWEQSQKVAEDTKLVITTFQDAPDPFAPSLTPHTLTATFQLPNKGKLRGKHDDDDDGENKDNDDDHPPRVALEVIEIIQDTANAIIRTLTTQHPINIPAEARNDRFIDMTIS